jgi:hypothetical protein
MGRKVSRHNVLMDCHKLTVCALSDAGHGMG